MALSLRQLRYFRSIAVEGSLTAAARALRIAQPALSYHLAALEADLGVALVNRGPRGTALTEAGTRLWQHADDVLHRIETAEIDVRSVAHEPHGPVSMTLPVSMAARIAPPLLRLVGERYPLVRLSFIDVPSLQAIEFVQSGRVDMGLLPNAGLLEDVEVEPVYRESLCFIRLATGDPAPTGAMRFAEIGDAPVVLSPRSFDLRNRVEDAALAAGHRLNVRYEQASNEMIRSFVLTGLAATVAQAAVFDPRLEQPLLEIRKLVEPEISRIHAIAWRRRRPLTLAAAAVKTALESVLHQLAASGILQGTLLKVAA